MELCGECHIYEPIELCSIWKSVEDAVLRMRPAE
jgi:hypothetical protein